MISSSAFCIMPWVNLATDTNGKCKICCVVMFDKYIKKKDGSDFLLYKDSIKEIWNSEYLKNLRKEMLNGLFPEDCRYCQNQEAKGLRSSRVEYNYEWQKLLGNFDVLDINSEGYASYLPLSLEPRPGNLCDLACHSCWSLSSSKVFTERKRLVTALENKNDEFTSNLLLSWNREINLTEDSNPSWPSNDFLTENIQHFSKDLRRIYFTGGEPTLIKSVKKIINLLSEAKNFDCKICFTTNLNFIDLSLFDSLKQFNNIEITGSIDSIGKKNEYIRFRSNWELIKKNIDFILSFKKASFTIMTVLQSFNLISFLEMIEAFANNPNYKNINFHVTYLESPHYLKISSQPKSIIVSAIELAKNILFNPSLNEHNRSVLVSYIHYLETTQLDTKLYFSFKSYLSLIDNFRKTDFYKTFPEFVFKRQHKLP